MTAAFGQARQSPGRYCGSAIDQHAACRSRPRPCVSRWAKAHGSAPTWWPRAARSTSAASAWRRPCSRPWWPTTPESHCSDRKEPGNRGGGNYPWRSDWPRVMVEVVPATAIAGQIVVEPAAAIWCRDKRSSCGSTLWTARAIASIAPRQAEFVSSDPKTVFIDDRSACALRPRTRDRGGEAAGDRSAGAAEIHVENEQITGLIVDPAAVRDGGGRSRAVANPGPHLPWHLRAFSAAGPECGRGRAQSPGGQAGGHDRHRRLAPGQALVTASWHGLSGSVPVSVGPNAIGGLRIDPAAFTIHPGDRLEYQASGVVGGSRRPLRGEDGLKLTLANPERRPGLGGTMRRRGKSRPDGRGVGVPRRAGQGRVDRRARPRSGGQLCRGRTLHARPLRPPGGAGLWRRGRWHRILRLGRLGLGLLDGHRPRG